MHGPIRVLFVGETGPQDSVTTPIEAADDRLSVVAVNTAAAAFAVLADGDVDCVVSEYELPETDGVEFLRRVRADDARLPFVLWTESGSERVASDAIAAGVTDYVPRTVDGGSPAELAARVADAVERARATPAPGTEAADDGGSADASPRDAPYAEERAKRERALRDAYDVIADPDRSFREQVDGLLELGREVVGVDYATFSYVNEDRGEYTFERLIAPESVDLRSGDTVPLDTTPNCAHVADTGESLVIQDVEAEAPELHDSTWGIASYIGAPVTVDDEVYGTFCFFDTEPRPEPFTDWEATYVDLLGSWVEYELRRRRTTDRLEALNSLNRIARDINWALANQSSRAEIERVVCRRLTDSDSYEFAWTSARDDDTGEIVPSTVPDGPGSIDGVAFGAEAGETDDTPAATALRTGEPQVVRDVRGVLDGGAWSDGDDGAFATIPITYEDRCYGLLNVYTDRKNAFEGEERAVVRQFGDIVGIAIAAVEHERELAHERERLEFVNRLLRHNLLNSLNVVEARAEMLDGRVESDAAPHLETLRNRTDDMIDLIETLRSLTNTLVQSKDPELEAVNLGRVLREEIARVEQASDRAVFEVDGDLDWAGTVMADDLLEELFENLLSNAVQHNDKRVPHVKLEVERDGERTAVRIADNGPGVPEEVRDTVFQKGQKGFESPGTGFGLYLVREIVEAYGGTVTVGDNEPEGAVFSVTLPSGREVVRPEAGGASGESDGSE